MEFLSTHPAGCLILAAWILVLALVGLRLTAPNRRK